MFFLINIIDAILHEIYVIRPAHKQKHESPHNLANEHPFLSLRFYLSQ